ncbi:murein biosynthesis integral membrane protein MurJ [Rubellicoccus peritrichatus]|uniref:Probable lipid II flippase MurJ n=1 Tax=Rubellicoccus peritrichatus TaxID=3080537 RepID=A0AAQ3QWE9_9BACT|nr:murein biosynthesis integral membrane protein MurJ [Puniceicoccus sp. CR14]WOO41805.1 murein biosynthesis integral membrane protein MurJ [Puniceicoccus sp. CR14]
MARHLQNIAVVAASTLGSRVLGLFRDVLMMSLLGTSPAASAFLFAFTVPNLFRRLLGEGALTSALVPVFSDILNAEGKQAAFDFSGKVLTRVLISLLWLTLAGLVIYGLVYGLFVWALGDSLSGNEHRWLLGCIFGALLLPYMVFVCLAAALGALLNVLHRFAVHALSSVWLNIAMIGAMLIGGFALKGTSSQVAWWLAGGVLLGGLAQFVIPMLAMKHEGWHPKWDLTKNDRLTELRQLFLPALAGAAIMQVNILVSRLFGFGLSDDALPALYLASRLIELPLGVFAIAIATVLFPNLSLHASAGDTERLAHSFSQGLRLIMAITVPAAVGLAVLSGPVLRLLFEWGRFTASDVSVTQPVLLVFSLAIPFYGASTFITRGYHATKDTRTPVRVAAWSFAVNLVASIVLILPLGILGLALANMLSAVVQTVLLRLWLRDKPGFSSHERVGNAITSIGISSVVMALVCWGGKLGVEHFISLGKLGDVVAVLVLVPVGVCVYFLCLWVTRFDERSDVVALLTKTFRR